MSDPTPPPLRSRRRQGAARRAPRVLCRGRDGDQGAGLDGPVVPGAGVLLPRDRPQQAGRQALRGRRAWCSSTTSVTCRPGSPIMLSAHGSAPEVVEAARARGSYVVDSVCPLVTKVHHEVKVRAGKGFRIVYVGHEGHEEAVGTMAVAPDSISRVESVAEVAALPDIEQPVALLAQTTLSHRDWEDVAVAVKDRFRRRVDAGPQRPVLRHDQSTGGDRRTRSPLRLDRCDRIRELVQHGRTREARPPRGLRPGVPRQLGVGAARRDLPEPSASRPAPRRPRSSSTP